MTIPNVTVGDVATEAWADAVADQLNAMPLPTAWVNVSVFTNSWVAFGGSEQVPRYRKIGDIVHVEGLMKSGTSGGAFTLPSGFRPLLNVYFTSNANGSFGSFLVTSAGVLQVLNGSNVYYSVCCSFSTI